MTGRRIRDSSPGFLAALGVGGALMMAIAMWVLTEFPPQEVARRSMDACQNGVVVTWDGQRWHPVKLKNKSIAVPCREK